MMMLACLKKLYMSILVHSNKVILKFQKNTGVKIISSLLNFH